MLHVQILASKFGEPQSGFIICIDTQYILNFNCFFNTIMKKTNKSGRLITALILAPFASLEQNEREKNLNERLKHTKEKQIKN